MEETETLDAERQEDHASNYAEDPFQAEAKILSDALLKLVIERGVALKTTISGIGDWKEGWPEESIIVIQRLAAKRFIWCNPIFSNRHL